MQINIIKKLKKISIRKNKTSNLTILNLIDKKISKNVIISLMIIFLVSFLTMRMSFKLTNIARENYYKLKEIEKVKSEISEMKIEIAKYNNLRLIQKESRENGFIDNNKINYINR